MVYVNPIQDSHCIIYEGPILGDLDPRILTSSDIHDIEDCWELSLLEARDKEWPALRKNSKDALEIIDYYIQPPGFLLDYGCGGGFFLCEAKKCGWDTYGLEPLPGHAVHARAKYGVRVITDTLRLDTCAPNFFDVITAFQVFEHLPDPDCELNKLSRIIKPGGIILIEVPNIDTWSVNLLGKRHRHFVQDHLNFFSPKTLSKLLEKNGFQVIKYYLPTRYMSIHHLMSDSVRRYLHKRIVNNIDDLLNRLGLSECIIGMNLRDIVAVVAQKQFPDNDNLNFAPI
jgi:SAM-dependent methyltransferase